MRAQISRISATTHISPGNFFLFDADEDDEMDARDTFAVNEEFEPISVQELVDESLSRWVHHVQFILPQVGVKWRVCRLFHQQNMERVLIIRTGPLYVVQPTGETRRSV